jgi:hypothetical protein
LGKVDSASQKNKLRTSGGGFCGLSFLLAAALVSAAEDVADAAKHRWAEAVCCWDPKVGGRNDPRPLQRPIFDRRFRPKLLFGRFLFLGRDDLF